MVQQYQLLLYVHDASFPDYQGVCTVSVLTAATFSPEDAHQLLLDMMCFCGVSYAVAGSVMALDSSGFHYWEKDLVHSFAY